MKITYCFYLFLLLNCFSYLGLSAQPYLHFPYENATWKYTEGQSDPNAGCAAVISEVVGTDRDSMFNGHRYFNFQLLGRGQYDYGQATCPPFYIMKEEGWVRTDTATGKTYWYDPSFGMDTLIYDVSLQVGDTFQSALVPVGAIHVVTAVDTIVVAGLPRRRVTVFDNDQFVEYFMAEGMGSSAGPLVHLGGNFDHAFSVLRCYTEDSIVQWINIPGPLFPGYCFDPILVGAEEALEKLNIEIGPVPANDRLRIFWPEGNAGVADLRLFSVVGEVVGKWKWEGGTQQEIPVAELADGIYFLEVRSERGQVRFRTVVQR